MGKKTRCPKWSASLPAQCELEAGHSGICDSGEMAFMDALLKSGMLFSKRPLLVELSSTKAGKDMSGCARWDFEDRYGTAKENKQRKERKRGAVKTKTCPGGEQPGLRCVPLVRALLEGLQQGVRGWLRHRCRGCCRLHGRFPEGAGDGGENGGRQSRWLLWWGRHPPSARAEEEVMSKDGDVELENKVRSLQREVDALKGGTMSAAACPLCERGRSLSVRLA